VHHAQPNVRTDDPSTTIETNINPNINTDPLSNSITNRVPIWQPNDPPIVDAYDRSKCGPDRGPDPVSDRFPDDDAANSRAELRSVSITNCVTCVGLQTRGHPAARRVGRVR